MSALYSPDFWLGVSLAGVVFTLLAWYRERLYRSILLACARSGSAERLDNGQFYYLVEEGEYNKLKSYERLMRKELTQATDQVMAEESLKQVVERSQPANDPPRARAKLWYSVQEGLGVQVSPDDRPEIQWNHVDGPVLHTRLATLHWLTWKDRLLLALKKTTVEELERKYEPQVSDLDRALAEFGTPT